MKDIVIIEPDGRTVPIKGSKAAVVLSTEALPNQVLIDVDTLETLAHGVAFARDVAQTLHVHFNDPAMERTQKKIHDAQREAMRLVGLARRP